MDKNELSLQLIVTSFVISVVASFIRLIFHRNDSFWQTVANFFGGIMIGVLVGFLMQGSPWQNPATAIAALTGREICKALIDVVPTLIKSLLTKKIEK